MAVKRFSFPINIDPRNPNSAANTEFFLEDYPKLLAASWVGEHNNRSDIELRTHDGKEPIVDSLPIAYYQLGNGREELVINRMLTGCALRIIIANEDGAEVEGTLVLTAEK